jgi:hypothetical protein
MTPNPVPSRPSREAVEAVRVKLLDIHLDEAKEARDMLRDLYTKVERLEGCEIIAAESTKEVFKLRATVAQLIH